MASTLNFNGRVTAVPGVYTRVDASGLAAVGLGSTGIVALVGEAEGGAPYSVGVHRISNPAKVARVFRSGDLLEAAMMAFSPSADPDIPGGAQEVVLVKVNPSTQAQATLSNADGPVLDVSSVDYGAACNQIALTVSDGSAQGKALTVRQGDIVEFIDDIGGAPVFSLEYTPGGNGADTMTAQIDADGLALSFTASRTGLAADYAGTAAAISGMDSDAVNAITSSATVTVVSASADDTEATVTIVGLDDGSGAVATETLQLDGTTPVAGTQTWSAVLGVIVNGETAGAVTVSDTGTSDPLFVAATDGTGTGVATFPAALDGGNEKIAVVADGASTAKVVILGSAPDGTPQAEVVTLNGTTPVASTAEWGTVEYLALGGVAAARAVTLTGLLWSLGSAARVKSSNAGDSTQTITIYGLNADGEPQSETIALAGTAWVEGVASWSRVLGATLSGTTLGTVTVGDADAALTAALSWNGASSLFGGFAPLDNMSIAGASLTVDGTATHQILLVGLGPGGTPQLELVEVAGGAHLTERTWSALTGICVAHIDGGETVLLQGSAGVFAPEQYPTIASVEAVMAAMGGWTIAVGDPDARLGDCDVAGPVSVIGSEVDFTADAAAMVAAINTRSTLITATRAPGATGAPSNVGPTYLGGGSEGTPTFADWQAALNKLRAENVSTVVALTSDAAVHAALKAHCEWAAANRMERDAIVGAAPGETLSQLKTRARELNTRHMRLAHQTITRFSTEGEREVFPPYFAAVIAAGMQAGASVGTPLTARYLNILDATGNDASYTIEDDADALIQAGLLTIERVQGVGFRWLRNVTTIRGTDNSAYVEASVNQVANYTAQELRRALEAGVGRKGFAGTANQARARATAKLGQLANPDDPIITAWRNLTVEITADECRVNVEVAPVEPTNFIPTTVHLTRSTITA